MKTNELKIDSCRNWKKVTEQIKTTKEKRCVRYKGKKSMNQRITITNDCPLRGETKLKNQKRRN